jgi:hypothetical protein
MTTFAKAGPSTAFVIGNGPSLKGVDLQQLNGFATFGMNAAYRYWREINWRPTFYVCLDLVVGISHKDAIAELIAEDRIERFLLRANLIEALGATGRDSRVVDFDALRGRVAMLNPPAITTGSHAALWAASMGFEQIVLLGIDGNYVEHVDGSQQREGIVLEIVERRDNPNYFFSDYQQPGDRYNIPNPRPDLHIGAWREAARKLVKLQVPVFNANAGSAVRVFPFICLADFLSDGSRVMPASEDLSLAALPEVRQSEPLQVRNGRLGRILRRLAPPLAAINLITVGVVLAALSQGVSLGAFLLAGVATLAGCTASLLVYTRMAVVQHLSALQAETDQLKARVRELERGA